MNVMNDFVALYFECAGAPLENFPQALSCLDPTSDERQLLLCVASYSRQ